MMLFGLRLAPPDGLLLQLGEEENAKLCFDWVDHQALWWDQERLEKVPRAHGRLHFRPRRNRDVSLHATCSHSSPRYIRVIVAMRV